MGVALSLYPAEVCLVDRICALCLGKVPVRIPARRDAFHHATTTRDFLAECQTRIKTSLLNVRQVLCSL